MKGNCVEMDCKTGKIRTYEKEYDNMPFKPPVTPKTFEERVEDVLREKGLL